MTKSKYLIYYYAEISGENTFNLTYLTLPFEIINETTFKRAQTRLRRLLDIKNLKILSYTLVKE